LIGVDVTGNTPLANGGHGVLIERGANGNTVGGPTTNDRNIISGNTVSGLYIDGSNSTKVWANYIGLGQNGTTTLANGADGITLFNGSSSTQIGGLAATGGMGNVISGNTLNGVNIAGINDTDNKVLNNYIGTSANGLSKKPNENSGVLIDQAFGNFIGDGNPGDTNLISGNTGHGILIQGSGAVQNQVLGDIIGLDITGGALLANTGDGVGIFGCDNNIIGGAGNDARNVISGNSVGIYIHGGNNNKVLGNYIGTDSNGALPAGVTTLGNKLNGIVLDGGATTNTIGLAANNQGNIISGNGQDAVKGNSNGSGINLTDTSNNVIQANYVGVDANGKPMGNQNDGIYIGFKAIGTLIGGPMAADGNVISANGAVVNGKGGYGIRIDAATATGTVIKNNIVGLTPVATADPTYLNGLGWLLDPGNVGTIDDGTNRHQ
jgi:hypothetical protein